MEVEIREKHDERNEFLFFFFIQTVHTFQSSGHICSTQFEGFEMKEQT
jgi:hypothetical protein